MQMVTIFRAFNPIDAQLVRARLEAAEFHPVVANELSALSMEGYTLAAGGILVNVPDDEAEEARKFLESSEATNDESS